MNTDLPEPGEDVYTDEMAVKDLTNFVAAVTSGMKGAIAESEDQDLAEKIVEMINTRYEDPLPPEDFEVTGMSGQTVEIHKKSTDQYKTFVVAELVLGRF